MGEAGLKEPRRADSSAEVKLNERTIHSGHITWDSAAQISNTSANFYLDKQINVHLCSPCPSTLLTPRF